MKKKTLKTVLWVAGIVVMAALIGIMIAYAVINYYFIPKMTGSKLSDMGIGITDVVSTITDKQVLDNILNFDKQSASEIMKAMTELDNEAKEEEGETDKIDPENHTDAPSDAAAGPKEGAQNSTDSKKGNQTKNTDTSQPIDTKGAYQRIMEEATKDEIAQGMAIISKVDMGKVNELRKNGDNSEVKAYIRSVLTPGEISTAVSLYNKYKHLL